jgi:hypothetical protein
MPRLNTDAIQKAQSQVYNGLQKIYSMAPDAIRPQMEYQYGSEQINQTAHLMSRMLREQKEDRINNLDLATKINTQSAFTAQLYGNDLDKKGDSKAALLAESTIAKGYDSAVNQRDKTPKERQIAIDTARQTRVSAKIIREGLKAQEEKREAAFRKDLADHPEKYVEPRDHDAVINNVITYLNKQNALRSEDENIKAQDMYNRIITNPDLVTGSEFAAFEQTVSPLKAAQMKFHLIQARNRKQKSDDSEVTLMTNYSDPRAHANATADIRNGAFNKFVAQQMTTNPNLSRVEAENIVAKTAGAPAPVFTKTLHNGLWSGDPAQMVEKAKQIDELQSSGNGKALVDLSEADKALASDISHNNNPRDPAWSARMITENRENQDEDVRKASLAAFNTYIYENSTKNNKSTDDFILGLFGMQGGYFHSGFDSPWLKATYATDISSVFQQNFINTRRDVTRATELTQQYINDNYGKTGMNGSSQWTKHPLEKACGFNEGEGIDSINKDIVRQVSIPMQKLKDKYDKNISDIYWSIEETPSTTYRVLPGQETFNAYQRGNRLQFVKHTRNGISTDTENFPLLIVGNNFNWELNVETAMGPRSIFLEAPEIGVHTYSPDVSWVRDNYMGNYHNFPYQKYVGQLTKQLTPRSDDEVLNG